MTSTTSRRAFMAASAAALAAACLPRSGRAQTRPALTSPPAVDVFAAPPAIDQIALSPDGQSIAVVSQSGDNKFLITMALSDKTPRSLSMGPAKVRDLFFFDNGHVILETSVTARLDQFVGGKHEFYTAHNVRLSDWHSINLFSGNDGFYDIVMGGLDRVRDKDGYRVTAANVKMGPDANVCLYSFAPDQALGHRLYMGNRNVNAWVVTPDGGLRAYSEFDEEHKVWKLQYNSAAPGDIPKIKQIHEAREALHYPRLHGLGRDGESVIIYIEDAEKGGDFYEIGPDGKLSAPLEMADIRGDVALLYHPVTRRMDGFVHFGDWIRYDYVDADMKARLDVCTHALGAGSRIRVESFADDPDRLIMYGETAQDGGCYYLVDLAAKTVDFLFDNYPDLPPDWITTKTAIQYKAADGLEIHAWLSVPSAAALKGGETLNLPLIVLPHGGPQAHDDAGFDWQVQCLNSRGYAVLQPNFRGSNGYGYDFVTAGHGEWGRKMQTDLSDGVRHLVEIGLADPKRVAIMGASYGGYAALAGATLDPGVYNCAVSIAGPSDLRDMIRNDADDQGDGDATTVLYDKEFLGDSKNWDAISPAKQAAKASCPILLIHGTDDTVVSIEQSRTMQSALQAAGKPVEFVTYKGQDHWETIGSARIDMMKAALAFLEKYNPA